MQTLKKELTIQRGYRFVQPVNVTENGAVLDLSGCTARMEIRSSEGVVLETLTSDTSGGLEINAPAGRITIRIPTSKTRTYGWDYGYYELALIYADNEWDPLMEGIARVDPQRTFPAAP